MNQQPEQNKTADELWQQAKNEAARQIGYADENELFHLLGNHTILEARYSQLFGTLDRAASIYTESLQKQLEEQAAKIENLKIDCVWYKSIATDDRPVHAYRNRIAELEKQLEEQKEEIERLKQEAKDKEDAATMAINSAKRRGERIAELEEALKTIRHATYSRDLDEEILDRIKYELTEAGFPYEDED